MSVTRFEQLVVQELNRANEKHGAHVASPHEGHSIIREEFEEYWDEVKANNRMPALQELVQLAAMCHKVAVLVYGEELAWLHEERIHGR